MKHAQRCRTCGWAGTYVSAAKANYAKRRHSCARHLARAEAAARRAAREAAVDRTPKPCLHKEAEHVHGTYAAYVLDFCRCRPCSDANSAYEANRTRQKAYGRWNGLIDAEPARAHVRALMAGGMGLKQINAAAGINGGVMAKLMYGTPRPDGTRRPPAQRLRPATADRILSVRLELADGAIVDSTETARRLQSLVALGWSASELARRIDVLPTNFTRMLHGRSKTTVKNARAVHALYAELVDQDPPAGATATRARTFAREHGWTPPLRIGGRVWIGNALPTPENDDVAPVEQLAERRLPFAPLGTYIASLGDTERLGERTEKAIERARKEGELTHRAADAIATALGLHVDLIWTPTGLGGAA